MSSKVTQNAALDVLVDEAADGSSEAQRALLDVKLSPFPLTSTTSVNYMTCSGKITESHDKTQPDQNFTATSLETTKKITFKLEANKHNRSLERTKLYLEIEAVNADGSAIRSDRAGSHIGVSNNVGWKIFSQVQMIFSIDGQGIKVEDQPYNNSADISAAMLEQFDPRSERRREFSMHPQRNKGMSNHESDDFNYDTNKEIKASCDAFRNMGYKQLLYVPWHPQFFEAWRETYDPDSVHKHLPLEIKVEIVLIQKDGWGMRHLLKPFYEDTGLKQAPANNRLRIRDIYIMDEGITIQDSTLLNNILQTERNFQYALEGERCTAHIKADVEQGKNKFELHLEDTPETLILGFLDPAEHDADTGRAFPYQWHTLLTQAQVTAAKRRSNIKTLRLLRANRVVQIYNLDEEADYDRFFEHQLGAWGISYFDEDVPPCLKAGEFWTNPIFIFKPNMFGKDAQQIGDTTGLEIEFHLWERTDKTLVAYGMSFNRDVFSVQIQKENPSASKLGYKRNLKESTANIN